MRGVFAWALLATWGCAGGPVSPQKPDPARGPGCAGPADCGAGETCLHGGCVALPTSAPGPTARLLANPTELRFGTVAPGEERSLSVVFDNDGATIVTLDHPRVEPRSAPFRLESLGSGPFWIRPGRSRAVFVTYAPENGSAQQAELVIDSAAPQIRVVLAAP